MPPPRPSTRDENGRIGAIGDAAATDRPETGIGGEEEGEETLSDHDIQIIYDILREASQSPIFSQQPFHAIFPAYRTVLARYELTGSNDRTYLRFLYRLEQRRAGDQTLFEAFEQRLAQLGIEVEFSSEGSLTEEERTRQHGLPSLRPKTPAGDPDESTNAMADLAADLHDFHRSRSRRASFSSFVDFEEHTKPKVRATSQTSVSRLQVPSKKSGAHMPTDAVRIAQSDQIRANASAGTGLRASKKQPKHPPRDVSPPSDLIGQSAGTPQIAQRSNQYQTQRSHASRSSSDLEVYGQDSSPINPSDLPSQTQLIRDADTFDHFRMRDLERQLIRQWRDSALRRQWENEIISSRADQFEKDRLLRHFFDRMKHTYRLKKHLRKAEEVFAYWEERARRARDTYLVSKAFTHWATRAGEEREDAAIARRHLLRVKFFHAWQEITAVNQLKAQRQILAKFFAIWKQRFVRAWVHENKAIAVYNEHLVENTYWKWFWQFCEARAPQWRNALIKRRYLLRFFEALVARKELSEKVEALGDQELKHRFFTIWRKKRAVYIDQEHEAAQFRQRYIVSRALPQWQQQMQLVTPARRVGNMVQKRILTNALDAWAIRTKMQLQARRVDADRIVRNVWTSWNDRLRVQVMQQQINDRLAVEALYRWVLAERTALQQRVSNERLARRTMGQLVLKRRKNNAQLEDLLVQFNEQQNNRLKMVSMRRWTDRLHLTRTQNKASVDRYERHLLGDVLSTWHLRQEHVKDKHRWAAEALYYLRARRTLYVWNSAVTESRKRKLQASYAKVRVEQKKKLANATLQLLQHQSQQMRGLQTAATNFRATHLRTVLQSTFADWRSRCEERQQQEETAVMHRCGMLATNAISIWAERSEFLRQQEAQAASFAALHVDKIAYESLRKLQLRIIERENLAAKAATIRSWSRKRFARRLMRSWLEDALQRGAANTVRGNDSAINAGPRAASLELSSTTTTLASAVEPFTATGPEMGSLFGSQVAKGSTLLPGYLSTPSRRAAHARAIVREPVSFTPATDPRAMRRAQVLQDAGIVDDDPRTPGREQVADEPLVRSLFRVPHTIARGSTLQSSTRSRSTIERSRLEGSLIPRSRLSGDRPQG